MSATPRLTLEELNLMLSGSPFHRTLGISIERLDKDCETLVMRLPYSQSVERADGSGQHHGGVIASLIDIAGDFALIARLGHGVPTINFRVDYIRPATKTDLIATARIRRAGRTVAVCDIEVVDQSNKIIALGRGAYGVHRG